ncbi:MAG: hypothetical protein H7Y17_10375 [Chlorobia bacterium]|nr:hypothetical protein [Fimbriimonadaceae bacterium]
MQKFIPIALMAILIVGCKGGDTTASTGGGESTTGGAMSADKSITLKMAPKQGEKYSYVMTSSGAASTEMGMTMTAEKVEADKITLVTTFDSMKMNGTDAPAAVMDAMKKMKVITEMDSSGKSLSTKIEGAPAGTPTPDASSTTYPTTPIKVGDTWEGTVKMSGTEMKTKYKLAKIETVGGMEVAVLESTTEGMPAGASQDGPTVTSVEIATGMPVSMMTKMKMKGADGKETVSTTEMKRK